MASKLWFLILNFIAVGLIPSHSFATSANERAFKLITFDSASLPSRRYVAGLQELGFKVGPALIDTNPLLDSLATGNLGAKLSFDVADHLRIAGGARYLHFFGGSTVNALALKKNANITKFDLNFKGYTAFLTSSYSFKHVRAHMTLQVADVSGSRVLGLVSAFDFALSDNWAAVVEAGYEFRGRAPRFSAGFLRTGPTFGTRLGLTYLDIQDSFVKYAGPVPVLDFYWLFGGGGK